MIIIVQCGTQQAPVLTLFTCYYPVWGHHCWGSMSSFQAPDVQLVSIHRWWCGISDCIYPHKTSGMTVHIFFPISPYTETSSAHFQLIHMIPLTALLPLTSNHRGPLSRSDWSTALETFTTSSFSSFTAYKAIKARPSTLQNSSFTTVVNRKWDACSPSPCCKTWSLAQHAEIAAYMHFSKLLFNYRNTGSEVTKEFL